VRSWYAGRPSAQLLAFTCAVLPFCLKLKKKEANTGSVYPDPLGRWLEFTPNADVQPASSVFGST